MSLINSSDQRKGRHKFSSSWPLTVLLKVCSFVLLWAETQQATVYMSLSASNLSVAAPSTYAISFNRSQNTLGQTITPSPLASNHLIIVSFATSYDISSIVMIPAPSILSSSTHSATLLLTDYITSITISNITNPLPSGTPFSISLNFYNATAPNSLIDSCSGSLTFSAVSLGSVSAVFDPGNVSTVSNLTIKTTPFAWDLSKMSLTLNFMTYWQRNLMNVSSNQVLQSMSYCVPACIIRNMGSFLTVSLSPTLVSGNLSLTIYNVLSPPTLEADSLSLAIVENSYSSNVQTGSFSVKAIYPNQLQILTLSTSSKVGEAISLLLEITSQDLFSSSDSIMVAFNSTLAMSARVSITNPLVSTFTAQVQQNYLVSITGFTLVTTIPSQFSGNLTITDIAAQSSTQLVTGNSITFYRNGAIYDQSYFQFSAATGTLSALAQVASSSANAATTLTLTITLNVAVTSSDYLLVSFDQAITLYNCTVAGCTGCQCALTAADPASGRVMGEVRASSFPSAGLTSLILLVGVKNPIASGYLLSLSTLNSNNYKKEVGQVAYPTISQSSISSSVFSLTKGVDMIYSIGNYTMTLNFSGYSLVKGWMTIKFDSSVTLLDPSSPQCTSNGDSAACSVDYTSGYIITNTSISESTSLYTIVLANCRNPTSTRYFSFKVSLTDSNNQVYYTLTSPYFQASTPYPLTPSVSSSSCTNGQLNTLSVNFPYLPFTPTSGFIVDQEGAAYLVGESILKKIGYPLTFSQNFTIMIVNSYSLEPVHYKLRVMTQDMLYYIFSFDISLTNCLPAPLSVISSSFSGLPEDPGTFAFSINQVLTNNAQGTTFTAITYLDVQFPGEYPSTLSVSSNANSTTTVGPRTFRLKLGTEQPINVELWGFTSVIGSPFTITSYSQSEAGTALVYLVSKNNTIQYSLSALTPCQFPCKICQESNSSICLQCYTAALTPQYILDPLSHTCVTSSNCPSSTFPNLTASLCQACPITCLKCTSLTVCTSCATNYYLLNGSCLTDCPSSYYPISISQTCGNCLIGNTGHCLTCISLNECSSCQSPYLFQPASKTCVDSCNANQVLINGTCYNCDPLCATCSTTTSACTSCSSGYYLLGNTCLTVCPSPYVPSTTVNSCENCSTACKTCSGSATTCTSCSAPLKLFGSTCISDCSAGYYVYTSTSGDQCLRCSSPCLNCSSSSVCTSCQTGYYFYNGACLLACPAFTYASATTPPTCLACSNACTSCLNGSSCLECQQGYYLSSGVCVSACGLSQYLSGTSCVNCLTNCLTCVSGGVCLVCSETTFLFSGECIQTCSVGYTGVKVTTQFLSTNLTTGACLSCDSLFSGCASCIATACVSCKVGYILYAGKCVSICPQGYLNISNACASCNSECKGCTNVLYNCTTCSSGFLYINVTTSIRSCLTECPSGTYASTSSCVNCLSPCLTCSGSASACLSCLEGFYYLTTTSLQCVSSCPSNSYLYQSKCIVCSIDCLLCDSLGCKQCNTAYYHDSGSIINGSTYFQCFSSCPASLSYPIDKLCSKCSRYCVTCSTSECLECSTGWVAYQEYCLSQCPPSTVAVSGVCIPSNSSYIPSTDNTTTTVVDPVPDKTVPVPFTIVTACLWLCVLISKYIHPQTTTSLSVFGLLSVVAVICNVFYLIRGFLSPPSGRTETYVYILIIGVVVSYLNNIVFVFLQKYTLARDEEFVKWRRGNVELVKDRKEEESRGNLEDQLNVEPEGEEEVPNKIITYECFWKLVLIIGTITSHNLYALLFSKLFGLSVFRAAIHSLKTFLLLNYLWVSSILSFIICFISGIVLAASVENTSKEYKAQIYQSVDLIVVNFIFFLLAFLLLRKKKDTWGREDISPHGSEQDSTKKVIFQQENNDFDMRSIIESQEEINGKVANAGNDPSVCQEGFVSSSHKSSTNEVDSNLFFEQGLSENFDQEDRMKLEDNILFMQIPPEDMTPNLIEKDTDDKGELENHQDQEGKGEAPSLKPDAMMQELDLKHIDLEKSADQASIGQEKSKSQEQEEKEKEKEEEGEEEEEKQFKLSEQTGEQHIPLANQNIIKEQSNNVIPQQSSRTEGLLLPIEEEEQPQHNRDDKQKSEDEGLFNDIVEQGVSTISPDMGLAIVDQDISKKKITESQSRKTVDKIKEKKTAKNESNRRRRREVKDRIQERYRQSPTEGKEKNKESARISGLKDMFVSSHANSPIHKNTEALSPSSKDLKQFALQNRYSKESLQKKIDQGFRVSSSAQNLINVPEDEIEEKQVFFDDKIETINAAFQEKEPQRYNYHTISKEKNLISESSNSKNIYKSINIAKINNRLGSALGDRPNKIEVRAKSREGIRIRSTIKPERNVRSTVKELSFSKPKERNDLSESHKKQIWQSRMLNSGKAGENLNGTAHIIQRKSKLASSRAELEHIYLLNKR